MFELSLVYWPFALKFWPNIALPVTHITGNNCTKLEHGEYFNSVKWEANTDRWQIDCNAQQQNGLRQHVCISSDWSSYTERQKNITGKTAAKIQRTTLTLHHCTAGSGDGTAMKRFACLSLLTPSPAQNVIVIISITILLWALYFIRTTLKIANASGMCRTRTTNGAAEAHYDNWLFVWGKST